MITESVSVNYTILPDGDTCEFTINFDISETESTYESSEQAFRSPVATKLFGFPWTQKVKVTPKSILVEKQKWVEWSVLAEPLAGLLREHFEKNSMLGKIEENPSPLEIDSQDPTVQSIQQIIETEINPFVAAHGGSIELVGVKDDVVYLRMGGGCQGCSQSSATLNEGVANIIKNAFPHIQKVVDVTQHSEGENPYM